MLQVQPVGQGEKVEQLWQRSVQSGGPVMYPALDIITVTSIVVKLREWVREVLGKGRSTIGLL